MIQAPKGSKIVFQVTKLIMPRYGGASVYVFEGTPFPLMRDPNCLLYDNIRNRTLDDIEERRSFRNPEERFHDQQYTILSGYTRPKDYYFKSKTETVSIYFTSYGRKPRRKGLKMFWTIESS